MKRNYVGFPEGRFRNGCMCFVMTERSCASGSSLGPRMIENNRNLENSDIHAQILATMGCTPDD